MELTDRIRTIMKMNNMNAAAFADRIGVQRANMSHVLTGRNKPSLDFIERILTSFPKVNAGWLITGKVVIDENQENAKQNELKAPTTLLSEATISCLNQGENASGLKDKASSSRKIVKIITFYEDFTFDEYRPSV